MAFGFVSIAHALLALLLIVELGMTAYVVTVTDSHWFHVHDTPSSFSFMLFNSVWSILILIYIGIASTLVTAIYNSIAALGLLALTTLFWFAGSIAMADFIGVPNCSGAIFCQTSQAAVAFGFFIWAIFTGLTVVEAIGFMKGGRKAGPYPNV